MSKKIHIEVLRILAIFFVVFNHTNGFELYQTTAMGDLTLKHLIYSTISSACKIAVPIFFMISGALLLGRNESYRILFKRIFRILVVLLIVSLIYYVDYKIEYRFNEFNGFDYLKLLYSEGVVVPLWYLYAYIGFLISLPFLRKIAINLSEPDIKYLFIIVFLFVFLKPFIAIIFDVNLNNNIQIFMLYNIVYFPILGYFIENRMSFEKITVKQVSFILCIIFIGFLLSGTLNYIFINKIGECSRQEYLDVFNPINATLVYIFVKWVFTKISINNKTRFYIENIGSCVFGVYLMEGIIRKYLYFHVFQTFNPYVKTLISSFLGVLACVIVGLLITFVIKKTRIGKKYL